MNSSDRFDQLQALIGSLIDANVAATTRMERLEETRERDRFESNERMSRLETLLATSIAISNARMERSEALVETSYKPVQALLEASTRHEAMIERLDAILERMVYIQGRGENDDSDT